MAYTCIGDQFTEQPEPLDPVPKLLPSVLSTSLERTAMIRKPSLYVYLGPRYGYSYASYYLSARLPQHQDFLPKTNENEVSITCTSIFLLAPTANIPCLPASRHPPSSVPSSIDQNGRPAPHRILPEATLYASLSHLQRLPDPLSACL